MTKIKSRIEKNKIFYTKLETPNLMHNHRPFLKLYCSQAYNFYQLTYNIATVQLTYKPTL